METLVQAVQVLATIACAVVVVRSVGVVNKMAHRERGSQPLWAWLGFGISYATLAASSVGAMLMVWAQAPQLGYVPLLLASAGLILFDRRRPAKALPGPAVGANDPQQVVQFDTFQPGCEFRMGAFCRNPDRQHPFQVCEHQRCPIMTGAASKRESAA